MQQIRILDEATPVPGTAQMRLQLSEVPDQTWIAGFRQFAAASADGQALEVHVEGHTLVFTCAERAQLPARQRLIGALIDLVNRQAAGSA